MRGSGIFVDTNILFYAHDRDSGNKYVLAKAKLEQIWNGLPPSVSVQVLQEFYVNLLRRKVSARVARETVSDYLAWQVIDNDRNLLQQGMKDQERWQLSLWDALILAAARRAGAEVIWSEDFNPGQDYGGVLVVNPLRE